MDAKGPIQSPPPGAKPANATLLQDTATFVSLYQMSTKVPLQQVKAIEGDKQYLALFSSPKDIKSDAYGHTFPASVTFSGACNLNSLMQTVIGPGEWSDLFQITLPPAQGKHYYYLSLPHVGLDLGASSHNVMISMDGPLRGSFSMPATSRTVTATISLTIDSAAPFVTTNNFGLGQGNGLFANPGTIRLDPGTNNNASTSGNDTVGLGVNLGPGWTVTSAKIVAASSVLDAPNDNTPDNAYRGASVTQMPSSGRLQTIVHWHYGVAESLKYTLEWQLQGPGGQRPLLTMPLGGPCDK